MSEYLTVTEISEFTNIPNSTCRRYIANFEGFFKAKGGSRIKKYDSGAVEIVKRIKQLYDEGLDTHEINDILVHEFPLVVSGEEQQEEQAKMSGLATFEDIQELKKMIHKQNEIIKRQNQLLEQQREYIDKRLNEHDRILLQAIRETQQEAKKQIAAAEEKKSFFRRLFKR